MGREEGRGEGEKETATVQVWSWEPVSWPLQSRALPLNGPHGEDCGKDPLRSRSFQKGPGWQHFPSHKAFPQETPGFHHQCQRLQPPNPPSVPMQGGGLTLCPPRATCVSLAGSKYPKGMVSETSRVQASCRASPLPRTANRGDACPEHRGEERRRDTLKSKKCMLFI